MEDRENREEVPETERIYSEYSEEHVDQNTRIYLGRSGGKKASANAGRTHYSTHAGGNRGSNRAARGKQPKKPSVIKLILKTLLVFVLVLFLWLDGGVMVGYVLDYTDEQDETWRISGCDRYFYDGNYGGLRDYLNLYDLYSEDYDVYWERVNGYEDYVSYLQWSNTSDQVLTNSTDKAEEYRQKVIQNAQNCQFEKNRKALEKWKSLVE